MIFSAEPPPCDGVGAGLRGAATGTGGTGAETGGAEVAAMAGSTVAPGMAAPHFEQNFTPSAIGDPQFPQNPATLHLRRMLHSCLAHAQHQRKSGHARRTRY